MILLRHGQTVFNVHFGADRIDPGVPDPALTDVGRDQAARAADRLAGQTITRVVASPYLRALETADIVARALALPVEVDPDIRERAGYSCDIGSAPAILARQWPKLRFDHLEEDWWAHTDGDPAAGGLDEPEQRLNSRVDRFRQRLKTEDDWTTTLVVCHWGPIRAMIGRRVENGAFARHDPTGPMGVELFPNALSC